MHEAFERLTDDIETHVLRNDDWSNAELLERIGYLTCSQVKLFEFLEDVVHPVRRDSADRGQLLRSSTRFRVANGYLLCVVEPCLRNSGLFRPETTATEVQPAQPELISEALRSFDESGVHQAWQKALDPQGFGPRGRHHGS